MTWVDSISLVYFGTNFVEPFLKDFPLETLLITPKETLTWALQVCMGLYTFLQYVYYMILQSCNLFCCKSPK